MMNNGSEVTGSTMKLCQTLEVVDEKMKKKIDWGDHALGKMALGVFRENQENRESFAFVETSIYILRMEQTCIGLLFVLWFA